MQAGNGSVVAGRPLSCPWPSKGMKLHAPDVDLGGSLRHILLSSSWIEVAMSRSFGALRLSVLVLGALASGAIPARADEVIDGDTLEVEGQRMRLFGIDAFELGQTCLDAAGQPWHCGAAAKAGLAELVQGQAIACTVIDDTREDGYIARCTVRDDVDLGAYMVRAGLALADPEASQDYVDEEAAAKAAAAGAWSGTFNPPWEWRGQ
jgi:endonuclease YncB( thermonuclease family)